MRIEKRNYVKPYTAVMNVQTEGVIATSAIIDEKTLCGNQYLTGGGGHMNCKKNDHDNYCKSEDFIENCNKLLSGKYHSCLNKQLENIAGGSKITIYPLGNGDVKVVEGWE